MEIVYFTVAGIALYFISDWILNQMEARAGRRFEYRTLVFFVIILVLSMSLFNLVQHFQGKGVESSAEETAIDGADYPDGGTP